MRAARADRWTRSRGGRDTRAAPRARRAGARACRFVWPRCGSAGAEVPYGFTALVPTGAVGRALHARLAGDHGPCAHTRGTHTPHTHVTRFTRDAAPAAAGEARARAAIPIEHRRPHRRAPVPAHRARGTSLHTTPLQERRIPTLATHRNTNVRFRCLVKPPPRGRGWTQCGSPWEGSCRCAPSTWPRGPPSPAAARARLAPAPPARLRTRSNPSGSRARPG